MSNLPADLKTNWIQSEVVMPADVNNWSSAINTLKNAMPHYAANGDFYTASYSSNIYTLTPSASGGALNASPVSYIDGMSVIFKCPTTNLANCQINVNNLGNKAIKTTNGENLKAGVLIKDEYIRLVYNSSDNCMIFVEAFADTSLKHLTNEGENRLHALKSYSDEGELLTDSEGYSDVLNYARSTFDSSKFTSLKVGSPVISADGIASGLGNNNYFNTGIVIGNKPFSITLKASWTGSITGQRMFQLGLGTYQKFSCYVQNNTNLQFGVTLSDSTTFSKAISNISGDVIINSVFDGTKYVLKASLDNGKTWSSNEYESSLYIENVDTLSLYLGNNFSSGTIDLKYLSVVVDGVTVLNGNITATDTYTIGGSTVSIPFTWSKTGSKIVDASQSTNLTNLYNQEGDAPYYMLDEANKQFALPMGELYGFIRRAGNDYSKPNFDSGVTITSPYTVEGGGWIYVKLDYFYNGAEFVANIDSTTEVIRYKDNAEVDHGSAITFVIPVQIGQVFTAVINNAQTGTAAVYKYFKNKGV